MRNQAALIFQGKGRALSRSYPANCDERAVRTVMVREARFSEKPLSVKKYLAKWEAL
jgi:hypothetical protein